MLGLGVVLLLATVHLSAFISRAAPSVTAAPMAETFALTDAQIGALQGPAFAVVYASLVLVAGHAMWRVGPFRQMAVCLAAWTAGGVLFALAQDYPTLMAARMMIGAGQAGFIPTALTVLGSPRGVASRSQAVSVFTSGSAIGRSGALFIGGALLILLGGEGILGLEPWRSVHLLLIAPNLLLILALWTLARRTPAWPATDRSGLADAVRWLCGEGRAILALFVVGAGSVLLVQAAGAWIPSVLHRGFGLAVGQAAIVSGVIVLVAAPAGHLTAGWLLGRRRSVPPGALLIVGVAIASLGACGLWAAPSAGWAIAALGLLVTGAGMAAVTALIAVQALAPERSRGAVNALFLALTSLVGFGVGPWITGWLSDRQTIGADGLALALIKIVLGVSGVVILIALAAGKHWSEKALNRSA